MEVNEQEDELMDFGPHPWPNVPSNHRPYGNQVFGDLLCSKLLYDLQ